MTQSYSQFNNANINIWIANHIGNGNNHTIHDAYNEIEYLTTAEIENSLNPIQYFINEITCVTYPWLNNIKSDYIGFQHYRRKFVMTDICIDTYKYCIEKNIMPYFYVALFTENSFINKQISDWLLTEDMVADIKEFLRRYFRPYSKLYEIISNNDLYPRCNIFFTSWEQYVKVAEFDYEFVKFIQSKYDLGLDYDKWKDHIDRIYIKPNLGKIMDYNKYEVQYDANQCYRIYGFILEFLNELYLLYISKSSSYFPTLAQQTE